MRPVFSAASLLALAAAAAFSQPNPPAAPYLACGTEPAGAAMNDTVVSTPDADGFLSLFDGKTDKGWWQSCVTAHGGPAKWKVVPDLHAIFSTQNGTDGGLLMTNKKFTHYELRWEYWPDFGNDGGIFNRTPAIGRCFQTVLDYIGGASVGGTWGENGFGSRDFRPFSFNGNEKTITIPGNGAGEPSNWTTITQKLKAAGQNFPCPTTGCTQAQWQSLWDFDNYNECRIQFYGGVTGNDRVRMKFWFRKIGATEWVPVSADTTLVRVIDPGYIGLQVHRGGRFSGPQGTWYRNIRWSPLSGTGERLIQPPVRTLEGKARPEIRVGTNALIGALDLDHEIILKDIRGKTVQTMQGKAGHFEYALEPQVNGWLSMEVKTSKGVEHLSFVRDVR